MNVLAFGASRNIGYYSTLRLLNQGATVTLLLRSLSCFDSDADMKHYIALGKAQLVEGDALKQDDVKAAWDLAANNDKAIDYVLFTIGGSPTFKLSQGFTIDPKNLCTQSLLNVICTMPKLPSHPKFIVITTIGLTEQGHKNLPILLKPLYGFFLAAPHQDKLGAERVIAHCTGRDWTDHEPNSDIMTSSTHGNWSDRGRLPAKGGLKEVLIIRPALFTDGECKGDKPSGANDKPPYKFSQDYLRSGYTVSRKDVAHFIVTKAMKNWSEFEGKIINIAY